MDTITRYLNRRSKDYKESDQISVTYNTSATDYSYPGEYDIVPVPNAFAQGNYALIINKGILTITKARSKLQSITKRVVHSSQSNVDRRSGGSP